MFHWFKVVFFISLFCLGCVFIGCGDDDSSSENGETDTDNDAATTIPFSGLLACFGNKEGRAGIVDGGEFSFAGTQLGVVLHAPCHGQHCRGLELADVPELLGIGL